MSADSQLYWYGDICHRWSRANITPDEDYKIGDSEPCVLCGILECTARVKRRNVKAKS